MNPTPEAIKSGQRRALAKAITLIESTRVQDRERAQDLLAALLPSTGHSIRIGITGVPGVGKSTFIEAFGLYLLSLGKKVAVLAVDPSSPIAGGSILGDKTRMEVLSRSNEAFIRPSPAGTALGGVAQKTRETMLLCEAAGYDVILVETVGVGQSEHQVAGMVDFFMLLMLPGGGDELQGIKKGILELADALVINKADGESLGLADQAKRHYQNAMHLLRHSGFWIPQVRTCSALHDERIGEVWEMIQDYWNQARANGALAAERQSQRLQWMHQLIREGLEAKLQANPQIKSLLPELEKAVAEHDVTTYTAAKRILDLL
ncbi:MAG: methylmalonyl Co-A mutase-associated GTPase MeaB [Halieaceae bacterium]|nr:methylmalonyl Co-A mutase-associated GTPase MeaB [Halieaceae bacterium]